MPAFFPSSHFIYIYTYIRSSKLAQKEIRIEKNPVPFLYNAHACSAKDIVCVENSPALFSHMFARAFDHNIGLSTNHMSALWRQHALPSTNVRVWRCKQTTSLVGYQPIMWWYSGVVVNVNIQRYAFQWLGEWCVNVNKSSSLSIIIASTEWTVQLPYFFPP